MASPFAQNQNDHPHCEGSDGMLMFCWAGFGHLQQATAIAAHDVGVKEEIGGHADPHLVRYPAA